MGEGGYLAGDGLRCISGLVFCFGARRCDAMALLSCLAGACLVLSPVAESMSESEMGVDWVVWNAAGGRGVYIITFGGCIM